MARIEMYSRDVMSGVRALFSFLSFSYVSYGAIRSVSVLCASGRKNERKKGGEEEDEEKKTDGED